MGAEIAAEISGEGHRSADEGSFHHDGIQDEIAQKNAYGENKYGAVWSEFSGSGLGKVRIHRGRDETIEEAHQQSAGDRERQSLGAHAGRSAGNFPVRRSVQKYRQYNKRHASEQQSGIAHGIREVVHHNTQNKRETDPHGKSTGHAAVT